MPAAYSLRSPNGQTIVYFVARTITGPTVSRRVRNIPVPNAHEKIVGNIATMEEKLTIIGDLVEVDEAGEETGVATGASQAAAEAATPTGTGQAALEKLLEAARTWGVQSGGRTRGSGAYPTAGGTTATGEVTLILGLKDDGTTPFEVQGSIENVTPTQDLSRRADAANRRWSFTLQFRIGEVIGA